MPFKKIIKNFKTKYHEKNNRNFKHLIAKLNQVANAIKANKQITAKLSGNYQSQAVTDFKIEVTIELDFVANAL